MRLSGSDKSFMKSRDTLGSMVLPIQVSTVKWLQPGEHEHPQGKGTVVPWPTQGSHLWYASCVCTSVQALRGEGCCRSRKR